MVQKGAEERKIVNKPEFVEVSFGCFRIFRRIFKNNSKFGELFLRPTTQNYNNTRYMSLNYCKNMKYSLHFVDFSF